MPALETISGFTTASAVAGAAVTMNSGSNVIRSFGPGQAFLLGMNLTHQTSGFSRVRSSNLHDAVQGIRRNQLRAGTRPCSVAMFYSAC